VFALLGVLTASKASFSLLRLPMMGARLFVSDFIDGREVDAGEVGDTERVRPRESGY
jgi:hypothetical protein